MSERLSTTRLKNLMKRNDATVHHVADRFGCSPQNIYMRIKNPAKFTLEEAETFANAIGVNTIDVIRCVLKV